MSTPGDRTVLADGSLSRVSGTGSSSDSGTSGPTSGSGSKDGLAIGITNGTAMFTGGAVCNKSCDVASLNGAAGIGGKETKGYAAWNDRSATGTGVMLIVTAARKTQSSEISALAVGQGMQVTVSGKGLATQALLQHTTAKFEGGAASVSALNSADLQNRISKITDFSGVPGSLTTATSTGATATKMGSATASGTAQGVTAQSISLSGAESSMKSATTPQSSNTLSSGLTSTVKSANVGTAANAKSLAVSGSSTVQQTKAATAASSKTAKATLIKARK